MSEVQNINIWNPEIGIEDLPQDIDRLASQSMEQLRQQWSALRSSIEGTEQLQTFTEQLAREWAIETGQIENLYHIERGVTLTLIEQGFSAAVLERGSTNKPRDYVLALISDQKDALDGLFDFVKQERPLSTGYIKELHAAMTRSQTEVEGIDSAGYRVTRELLRGEYKQQPNFPERDGKRFNYCPPEQTASEMERLVALHLEHVTQGVPAEVEAAWLHHRFTQIHPFMDGNGRVARALASLVLIRAGMFPFVMPLEEKDSYLDALEAADEGNLRPMVMVVARRQQDQYQRATVVFARSLPQPRTVKEAATRLAYASSQMAERSQKHLADHTAFLEKTIREQGKVLLEEAISILKPTVPKAGIVQSSPMGPAGPVSLSMPNGLIDKRMMPASKKIEWNLRLTKNCRYNVYLCPARHDIEGLIYAIATSSVGDQPETPTGALYSYYGGEDNEATNELRQWLDDGIAIMLNSLLDSALD